MNLNAFARKITEREGLKKPLSIAQVKEVIRLTFEELARCRPSDVLRTVERYEGRGRVDASEFLD